MTSPGTISAMVLVRDRADLLVDALDSIDAQERAAVQIVVVDDASSDATPRILAERAVRDPHLTVLTNERQLGIPASRNRALVACTGDYVAICDSDDISRAERFVRLGDVLDRDATVVGAGGMLQTFATTPGDGAVPTWHWGLRDGRMPFAFPAAMFRREALVHAGGFDERFAVAEDLDLCFRLAAVGGTFVRLTDVVLDYRVHAGSVTVARRRRHEAGNLQALLRAAFVHRYRLSARGWAVVGQSVGRTAIATLLRR